MLAAILIIPGCGASIVTDSACLVFEPIYGDPVKDTAETMEQIDEHNAVGVEICGW